MAITIQKFQEILRGLPDVNLIDGGRLRTDLTTFDWSLERRSQERLRYFFLDGIAKYVPSFMEDFYSDVFVRYHEKGLGSGFQLVARMLARVLSENPYRNPADKNFRLFLRRWLRERNLDADWVFEVAFQTLDRWMVGEQGTVPLRPSKEVPFVRNKIRYKDFMHAGVIDPILAPPPGMPDYTPTLSTREKYLQRITHLVDESFGSALFKSEDLGVRSNIAAVKDALLKIAETYCKNGEAEAMRMGDVVKPIVKNNLERDIEWSVYYQVLSMKSTDIARGHKSSKVNHRTVDNAVKRILDGIGLPPRQ